MMSVVKKRVLEEVDGDVRALRHPWIRARWHELDLLERHPEAFRMLPKFNCSNVKLVGHGRRARPRAVLDLACHPPDEPRVVEELQAPARRASLQRSESSEAMWSESAIRCSPIAARIASSRSVSAKRGRIAGPTW